MLLLLLAPLLASAETPSNNYEKQSLSVSYSEEDGLPTTGVLNGTVTELDDLSPTIALNKTQAELNCSSGFMSVKLKFEQAFFGIVYADFDRNSACRIAGNGKTEETIQLPLKGCGTLQVRKEDLKKCFVYIILHMVDGPAFTDAVNIKRVI